MINILITGSNSYVGQNFEQHLLEYKDKYHIDTLDMKDNNWVDYDFSKYDVIYHVAGIAHSDYRKLTKEQEALYRSVNTDLAVKCASKAKDEGVSQFIFMSSSIVFGKTNKKDILDLSSPTNPINAYGDSKLQAEIQLRALEDDNFKVCIIRSPMIYGKDSKGNFVALEKYASKLPIFPYVKNERSMIYIKNLVEFVRLLIDNHDTGTFMPQNDEYSNTSLLVKLISKYKNHKLILIHGFGWLIKCMSIFIPKLKKAFGSIKYSKEVSKYKSNYILYSLEDSIKDIYN